MKIWLDKQQPPARPAAGLPADLAGLLLLGHSSDEDSVPQQAEAPAAQPTAVSGPVAVVVQPPTPPKGGGSVSEPRRLPGWMRTPGAGADASSSARSAKRAAPSSRGKNKQQARSAPKRQRGKSRRVVVDDDDDEAESPAVSPSEDPVVDSRLKPATQATASNPRLKPSSSSTPTAASSAELFPLIGNGHEIEATGLPHDRGGDEDGDEQESSAPMLVRKRKSRAQPTDGPGLGFATRSFLVEPPPSPPPPQPLPSSQQLATLADDLETIPYCTALPCGLESTLLVPRETPSPLRLGHPSAVPRVVFDPTLRLSGTLVGDPTLRLSGDLIADPTLRLSGDLTDPTTSPEPIDSFSTNPLSETSSLSLDSTNPPSALDLTDPLSSFDAPATPPDAGSDLPCPSPPLFAQQCPLDQIPSGDYFLTCMRSGACFPLSAVHSTGVGRSASALPTVSRHHFAISLSKGCPYALDTSKNGTFVNRVPLSQNGTHRLEVGDVISISPLDAFLVLRSR